MNAVVLMTTGLQPFRVKRPDIKRGDTRKTQSEDEVLGRLLSLARRRAGPSQRELGQSLGVTPQQIGKYERGESSLKAWMLVRAAEFLRVEVTDLVMPRHGWPGFSDTGTDYAPPTSPDEQIREELAAMRRSIDAMETLLPPLGKGRPD